MFRKVVLLALLVEAPLADASLVDQKPDVVGLVLVPNTLTIPRVSLYVPSVNSILKPVNLLHACFPLTLHIPLYKLLYGLS